MAGRGGSIEVRLVSSGADRTRKDLESVANSVGRMGRDVDQLANRSTSSLNRIGSGFTNLASKASVLGSVSPVLGGLATNLDSFGSKLVTVEAQSAALGGSLTNKLATGANVATTALVAAAAIGVGKFVQQASEIRGVQRIVGDTAEEASRLAFIGHSLGIETETLGRGFFLLSGALTATNKPLAKYGIEAVRSKNGSIDLVATLLNVSDAYNRLAPGVERNNLLADVFGKRFGIQLAPLLAKGREGIKQLADEADRLGLVFHQAQLDQAKNFGLAMREVQAAASGLAIGVANGIVPALTTLGETLVPIIAFLNQTHLLSAALAGLIAGKLAAAIVGFIASGAQLAQSAFVGAGAFARLEASATAAAVAETEAATAAAASGAAMTGVAASVAGLAGPIGILVGLGFALLTVSKNAHQANIEIGDLANKHGRELAAAFEDAAQPPNGSGPVGGPNLGFAGSVLRAVGVIHDEKGPSSPPSQHSVRQAFSQVIDQGQFALAQKIIDAERQRGRSVSDLEAKLSRAISTQKALNALGAQNADILGENTSATDSLGDSYSKAGAAVDAFNNQLAAGIDAAANVRSAQTALATEQDKLNQLLAENPADVHAQKLDEVSKAERDLTKAHRARTDALSKLHEVESKSLETERARAALDRDRAALGRDEAVQARDTAQAEFNRVSGDTASTPEQIAAARFGLREANQRLAESTQAAADAQKDYDEVASGRAHEQELADARDAVATATDNERDAERKRDDARRNAIPLSEEVAKHNQAIADQLDRVVQAAEGDWKAKLAGGFVTTNQAAAGLLTTLQSLGPLVQNNPVLAAILNAAILNAPQPAFKGHPSGGSGPVTVQAAYGGITNSPTVLYGERQTGGEAFIPRRGISSERGRYLADVAAQWHGGRVIPLAGGGILGRTAGFGTAVQVVSAPPQVVSIPERRIGMIVENMEVAVDNFADFNRKMTTERRRRNLIA